jgi:prenylated cyclic peptide (anacyclamide/piricyclamide family)
MKKNLKNLMPQTVAPVQRETSATVSRDGSAIAAAFWHPFLGQIVIEGFPFAGDDAE